MKQIEVGRKPFADGEKGLFESFFVEKLTGVSETVAVS